MLFRVRCITFGETVEVFIVQADSAASALEKLRSRGWDYELKVEPIGFDADGVLHAYDSDCWGPR